MAFEPSDALLRELARLVGSANVLQGGEADALAVDGVRPFLGARPGTLEELSSVMKLLGEAGAAILPRGSGSFSEVGLPPARYDVALLMEGMNQLVEYNPDDLTVGMQAGMRFRDLQEALRPHRQWLALDPPAASRATLGGVFAGGRIGPRRVSTGAPRDRVLGVSAVLADGTVARSGGRVVKNVSGYDLHRLYTGSRGTLAILAQIHVRLLARPERAHTLLVVSGSGEESRQLLAGLRAANLEPAALELLDGSSVRAASAADSTIPWRASVSVDSWTVALLFEGDRELVEARSRAARELLTGRRIALLDGAASDSFWESVADLSAPRGSALAPDGRGHLLIQACVLPSEVARTVSGWKTRLSDDALSVQIHAHAGSGHSFVRISNASIESLESSWDRLREYLQQVEGTAEILDAPTALKRRVPLACGGSGPAAIMKSLKECFDPGYSLSPGRMEFER